MDDYNDLIVRLAKNSAMFKAVLKDLGLPDAATLLDESLNAIYDLRDRLDKVESYLDYIDSLNKRKVKA